MNTIEAIQSRRSIRVFKDQPIEQEKVDTLLKAAMAAPSAGNQQPWHFILIDDKEVLSKVPSFHPYSGLLLKAPLAILVCGDPRLEKYEGFWVQDCSAASQNILLAAHDLGLGAVWLGLHPIQERVDGMRELVHLPEIVVPLSLIAVGYPDEAKGSKNNFRKERIFYNSFGKMK